MAVCFPRIFLWLLIASAVALSVVARSEVGVAFSGRSDDYDANKQPQRFFFVVMCDVFFFAKSVGCSSICPFFR